MNESNKKFKRMLTKKLYQIKKDLKRECEEYINAKMPEDTIAFYNTLQNKPVEIKRKYLAMIKFQKTSYGLEFKKIKSSEYAEIARLEKVLKVYKRENYNYFEDFTKVIECLCEFEFTLEERADVIAYFLFQNYLYYKNFRYAGNEDKVKEVLIKKINGSNKKMSKRKQRKQLEIEISEFDENQERRLKNYAVIRKIINEKGELLPFIDFTVQDALMRLDEPFAINLIDTLLKGSRAKALGFKEKSSLPKKTKPKQVVNEQSKPQLNKPDNTLKREAKEKLKEYLKNDKPICYITSEKLDIIVSLLRQTGEYSEIQIANIKTKIFYNNLKLKKAERNKKILLTELKYLSLEEMEILNSARSILQNPSKLIVNSLFDKIAQNYRLIEQLLLFISETCDVFDVSNNAEAEVLIYCIEDLRKTIINYNNSNYELSLLLKDKGN